MVIAAFSSGRNSCAGIYIGVLAVTITIELACLVYVMTPLHTRDQPTELWWCVQAVRFGWIDGEEYLPGGL